MKNEYRVLRLSELVSQLRLPSSKGLRTHQYLERVIGEIENNRLKFIQFLQLIDVLYVIIQVPDTSVPADKFRPEEEIRNHYNPPSSKQNTSGPDAIETDSAEKFEEAIVAVKSRDHLTKNMSGARLPWKK
jgi:hypothetical protein